MRIYIKRGKKETIARNDKFNSHLPRTRKILRPKVERLKVFSARPLRKSCATEISVARYKLSSLGFSNLKNSMHFFTPLRQLK